MVSLYTPSSPQGPAAGLVQHMERTDGYICDCVLKLKQSASKTRAHSSNFRALGFQVQ